MDVISTPVQVHVRFYESIFFLIMCKLLMVCVYSCLFTHHFFVSLFMFYPTVVKYIDFLMCGESRGITRVIMEKK